MAHSGYSDDFCVICGTRLTRKHRTPYCQKHYVEHQRKQKIERWLNSGDTGTSVDTTIRGVIREYILDEQNQKCAICGIKNVWNGIELKFILDHIDGDASNSERKNLRLICPNCDSQLDTYKSKNKNSSRNKRKVFLKETTMRINELGELA